jgi:hypothetical protein
VTLPYRQRAIPEAVYLDLTGEWLLWDPWDGGMKTSEFVPDDPLVDEFAKLGRPMSPRRLAGSVLEFAQTYGPLTWCSICLNLHHLDWRMTAPGKVRPRIQMKEWLPDWAGAARHVNALRRMFAALRSGSHAAPSDWDIVWPTRTGPYAWGDPAWERAEVGRHLSSWRLSCHEGPAVTWREEEPDRVEVTGSLLGDIGARLSEELLSGTRYRVCSGSVRGQACGVTEVMVRDRERTGPLLCATCDAVRRKQIQRSQKKEVDDG